jgi:hypothetical protein
MGKNAACTGGPLGVSSKHAQFDSRQPTIHAPVTMPRVPLNLDPRVLAKLRAAANREGVSVDDAANRLLGYALRTPLSTGSPQLPTRSRPVAQSYDYEDPLDAPDLDDADDTGD